MFSGCSFSIVGRSGVEIGLEDLVLCLDDACRTQACCFVVRQEL